jgi:excisionase family DNA binding protein
MADDLLTLEAAASKLGIHVTTLRTWVRTGRVPAFRLGQRFVRVDWDALIAVLGTEASKRTKNSQ